MESLKLLEELNKLLIDANKRCDIVYSEVGEQDKIRSDIEHELINSYSSLKAKEKREYTERIFECLAERHNLKYEYRELEILKDMFNSKKSIETTFNDTIAKLRKLNQELESPIYYKRAKKNKGQIIIVRGEEKGSN